MTARDQFALDPEIVFLNHGAFGACPRAVLAHQTALRDDLERDPVRFFETLPQRLGAARERLAGFVGADPADLAFVNNATSGVNAVVRSLDLAPGDEVVTTTHEYNATRNALDYAAQRAGARMVVADVPFPIASPDQLIDAVMARVGERTRLVLADHITSPTALIFPIAALAAELTARGVELLIDGAHAPGQLPLSIGSLGAAYYTANCHKWLCAPKGAALLWVRADHQRRVRPTVISHGANAPVPLAERFRAEFDWTGTDDPTASLSVPAAIDAVAAMRPGGWGQVRADNHALALAARRLVCDALSIAPPCPDDMIGSMAALPLPVPPLPWRPGQPHPIKVELYDRFRIQVPVYRWQELTLLRLSAHVYNDLADYEQLATALVATCRAHSAG